MNHLFKENFDENKVKVSIENGEFIKEGYDTIRADLFLAMKENINEQHYHIEFQTLNDNTMVFRMLEYGFQKGMELQRLSNREEIVVYMPKQLVIFIEENNVIKDKLRMRIVFPEGPDVKYTVPVMKYWQYDDKDLLDQKLYPLLPLQIFKLRRKMEKIKRRKKKDDEELQKLIEEAKQLAEKIANEGKELYSSEEINGNDLHKVLLAINNLLEYLNKRYGEYGEYDTLEEEVFKMTKSLYDPEVEKRGEKRGILKTATNGINKGISLEIISEMTGLSIAELKQLQNEMRKPKEGNI